MTVIYKYRRSCLTTGKWVIGYADNDLNNNIAWLTVHEDDTDHTGHTMNENSLQLVDSVSKTKVKIDEGILTDTGKLCISSLAFDCPGPAGTKTDATISWPYKVGATKIAFSTTEAMRGDILSLIVGEHTTAGALASNVAPASAHVVQNYTAGDVVTYSGSTYTCHTDTVSSELPTDTTYWTPGFRLHVSQTVIDNVNNGYRVRLTDGTNTDDMGEVFTIDTANNYIYVENVNTLSNSYSAATPTYVQLTVYMMEGFEISGPVYRDYGSDKIGGCEIPAGTVVTIRYENVDGVAGKRFVGEVQFLRGENWKMAL